MKTLRFSFTPLHPFQCEKAAAGRRILIQYPLMILGKDNIERLPPPVGTSDWATFSRDSYCVDKTLMIKELIDTKTRVALFTRPRRFGKTTALEMIRAGATRIGTSAGVALVDELRARGR